MQSQTIWSVEKQQDLAIHLTGFWAEDIWNMNKCPLLPAPTKGLRYYRFICKSPSLNLELKYVAWSKHINGSWNLNSNHPMAAIIRIATWINETHPNTLSFLEKSLEFWRMSMTTFFEERGQWYKRTQYYLKKNQREASYESPDRLVSFLNQIYKTLEDTYDSREEYEKDVWRLIVLGIPRTDSKIISFKRLLQPWLRQTAKRYIRYKLATCTSGTCLRKLLSLIHFSRFLSKHNPTLQPAYITREIIEEYLAYLQALKLGVIARSADIRNLREFLELCARCEWISVPEKTLIYKEDIPIPEKSVPRFITEEVLDRLLTSLTSPEVPKYLELLTRIGLHTGMRIADALALKRDCLLRDTEGDYWITFHIRKMKKDHSLPLDRELTQMIQVQQEESRKLWGDRTDLLFPNTEGDTFSRHHIASSINKVLVKNNIRKPDGSVYRFQFHQLRHTCATRMINSGYAHKVVQDWLGHESSTMTDIYAKLFDRTVKAAFQKYLQVRGPLINIRGEAVNADSPVDGIAHQMLKDQIKDRRLSLPHGHCSLPIALGVCPKSNACYQCNWFLTDKSFLPQHERNLREAKLDLAKACKNGWERHVEKLEGDVANLSHIIVKLKDDGTVET